MATTSHEIDADVKRLVLARLEALPPNIGIAVGSDGSYTRKQLLKSIEDENEIGKKFVDIELEFLRALKETRNHSEASYS
jgi:hypothetical protein